MVSESLDFVIFIVSGAEESNSIYLGIHGISLPKAVRCHLHQWGVPTYERGLHQTGRDDQYHEEPQRTFRLG